MSSIPWELDMNLASDALRSSNRALENAHACKSERMLPAPTQLQQCLTAQYDSIRVL